MMTILEQRFMKTVPMYLRQIAEELKELNKILKQQQKNDESLEE